ncbi:DUF3592 domain-containing protein [Aquitalea aquatilis]|uniref:DUF3592 domain-containing protein n=1 Tax=Aquitalea aquatilis TaxID=1537400 RepID=UPI0010BD5411|nr:DUF3592 domain-containing protein [Aquitalea aquatilis]
MVEKLLQSLMLLAGLAAFGYLWWLGAKGDASSSWPSAVGIVQQSQLEQRQVNAGGDRDNTWEYFPHISYHYQVQGQDYQSTNRRFPNPGYSRSQQEVAAILARYPAGAQVRVYYNPANPAEACLETGQHWTAWVGKVIALLMAVVAAWLLWRGQD